MGTDSGSPKTPIEKIIEAIREPNSPGGVLLREVVSAEVRDLVARLHGTAPATGLSALLQLAQSPDFERFVETLHLVENVEVAVLAREEHPDSERLKHSESLGRYYLIGTERREPFGPTDVAAVALIDVHRPTRVRLGTEWVKNEAGSIVAVSPGTDLSIGEFLGWLRQEFFRQSRAALEIDQNPPESEPLFLNEGAGSRKNARGKRIQQASLLDQAEERLWVLESSLEAKELVCLLAAKATGREREVLMLLAEGNEVEEVAQLLGIAQSTVRVLRHRLGKKRKEIEGEEDL